MLDPIPLFTRWFGFIRVRIYSGWTETAYFQPGRTAPVMEVIGLHDEQPGQAETAERIGAPSVQVMNEDHDLLHSLLAHSLGIECSPAMRNAAGQDVSTRTVELEEEAVLAIQAYMYAMGVRATDWRT